MIEWLLLVVTLLGLHYWLSKPRLFPGPKPNYFIGNVGQIERKKLHKYFAQLCQDYGPFSEFWIFNQRVVVTNDPETVKTIYLTRPATYERSPKLTGIFKVIGASGLFDLNGMEWQGVRKAVSPAFTKVYVGKVYDLISNACHQRVKTWNDTASQSPTSSVSFAQGKEEMFSFTLDTAFLVTFGYDCAGINADPALKHELALYFDTLGRWLAANFPYYKYFHTEKDRQFEVVRKKLKALIAKQLDLLSEKQGTNTILKGVLEGGGKPLSRSQMISTTLQFVIAAYHTTAVTLSICLYYLAVHPEEQEKIRNEFRKIVGIDGHCSYEQLHLLTAAKNFVMEVMRLSPIATISVNRTSEPVRLGGVVLPKHTMIASPAREVGLALFPDGAKFNPDRFNSQLTPDQKFFSTIGFGGGRRMCIGQNIAMSEMILLLSLTCNRFQITTPSEIDLEDSELTFVIEPTNPIPFTLTKLDAQQERNANIL